MVVIATARSGTRLWLVDLDLADIGYAFALFRNDELADRSDRVSPSIGKSEMTIRARPETMMRQEGGAFAAGMASRDTRHALRRQKSYQARRPGQLILSARSAFSRF